MPKLENIIREKKQKDSEEELRVMVRHKRKHPALSFLTKATHTVISGQRPTILRKAGLTEHI